MNLTHKTFSYELPTEIVFGLNAIQELADRIRQLKGSKVLIISDEGVKKAGILQKITNQIDREIEYEVFSAVDREPDIATIIQIKEQADMFNADLFIGVGGGSAQDAAKAVAMIMNNPGELSDYAGLEKMENQSMPTICIPTTSGTGSEVTIWTVISDKKNNAKFGIGGKSIAPTLALCDPNLTLSLPASITAATGVDALTHALESFVNKQTQSFSEALSRESMKLISKSLRQAVHQGDNIQARYDMLLASTIAASAFNPTRLGLSHALCMPIGSNFDVPHGLANAILLPQVMEYNLVSNLEKFKEIAEIFGEDTTGFSLREAAELSVEAIKKLNVDIGINFGFEDFGISERDLDFIAEGAINSDNVQVNPRKPSLNDLKDIVRKSL